jgi:beta-glucosidase
VLLKNEGSLPLKKDQTVAVIGPYGESRLTLGFWASVSGKPQDTIPLKSGLLQHFAPENLIFARGYNLFDSYEQFGPLKAGIEQLNGPIEPEDQLLLEAMEAAEAAEVIVLTFGEQFLESGEGASKAHLQLPLKQIRLIQALKKTGKPLIGVLYTGRPLVLTQVEALFDSLLLVWYPGTMGGIGIANLLSGQASPTAKLAMTFPRSEGQIPLYSAQLPTGRPLTDSEHSDRFLSKYRDESNEPLFSFGTGLSYSSFTGEWLGSEVFSETIQLAYRVKNQSATAAETVIQLYLMQRPAAVVRPSRQLIASDLISFAPQEEKERRLSLPLSELVFYDNQGKKHITKGTYRFLMRIDQKETMLSVTI